ncbi:TetR/AcrR family transcriptional regulator [Enemella evansiae]|uniref:TetR/AcrR family transcriptional regulator n=1 Tax=Enemella evansiae TaxID=2016499 RepID=UPI000B97470D|nr:TetR/AcrR family transcriptional regulator [Enemella evansiae]OYN99806.1 TetR family transcriptional regulator [Enemella evansiae]
MREDKQQALLRGALRVFARDGYTRASIQTLAAEAGVSTRTIYNQYGNKEALFRAVILDSARQVAERESALADRLLGRITDLRADLIEFGIAWATPDPASADHFAMVRQVRAEQDHIDPEVLAAWQQAGPERVTGVVAGHLAAMAERGLLRIDDPDLAAVHLIQLTANTVQSMPAAADPERIVTAGVDAFLHGYGRSAD